MGKWRQCDHKAKDGDNIFHQIVPPTWLIFLFITNNIPPEKQCRVPIIQHLTCEGELFPHGAQQAPLTSQNGRWSARLHGCHDIAVGTSWPWTFRGKSTTPNLVQPVIYNMDLSLNICGTSGLSLFFKNCILGIHIINTQLEKNMWVKNTYFPRSLDTENRGRGRKTQHEKPVNRKGFFKSEKNV